MLVEADDYMLSPPVTQPRIVSPFPSSVSLQDDSPKRRGNSGGSSGMREAFGPPLLEQRLIFPWAITPSKYIAHRGLRSAINCYAIREGRDRERKRGRGGVEDSGDLERLPSRSSNKIRFKIQCVTCAVHEPLRRSAVAQSELVAPCKMQLRSRPEWFLGKYIEAPLLPSFSSRAERIIACTRKRQAWRAKSLSVLFGRFISVCM